MPQRSDARLAELIATHVLKPISPKSVLDVGCGDGIVGDLLDESCRYRGLDIVDACIYAQRHDKKNLCYVQSDKIPEAMSLDGPWDTILLLDVIEHTRGFTTLFEQALDHATQSVIVSLPNELFLLDRLRTLFGRELNAHSLDLIRQPEGFKHQFIINIDKARLILDQVATMKGYRLTQEIQRPLIAKKPIFQPLLRLLRTTASAQLWSMGSIFVFEKTTHGSPLP